MQRLLAETGSAMVQAWYMDESADDPRLPHRAEPSRPVGLEQLRRLGVLYWKVGRGSPPHRVPRAPRTPQLAASGDRGRDRAGGWGEVLLMLSRRAGWSATPGA